MGRTAPHSIRIGVYRVNSFGLGVAFFHWHYHARVKSGFCFHFDHNREPEHRHLRAHGCGDVFQALQHRKAPKKVTT